MESYAQKSNLGAPNRKYYRIKESFRIKVSLAKDSFVLLYDKDKNVRNNRTNKLYSDFKAKYKKNSKNSLFYLRELILDIDNQVVNAESYIDSLYTIRRKALEDLRTLCNDMKLDETERNILQIIVTKSRVDLAKMRMRNNSLTVGSPDSVLEGLLRKLDATGNKSFLPKTQ